MDVRSRPELVEEAEEAFLRFLLSRNTIHRNPKTGEEEVWLSPLSSRRLQQITRRHVDPGYAAAWRKTQAERPEVEQPKA